MTTALLTRPPVVDELRRREALGLLAAAGVLAGCADDEPAAAEPGAGGYPRDVEHPGGTARIERRPERVACLSPLGELEALLALGVAPVQLGVRPGFESYTGGALALWPWQEEALQRLGAEPERVDADLPADPEVVVRAEPDLILGQAYWLEARAQLERLAPVVEASFEWRANLRVVGEVFDLADEAEALVADVEARMASVLDGEDLGDPTIAFVYPYDDGTVSLSVLAGDPIVDLFTSAGFRVPEALSSQPLQDGSLILSFEQLDLLGGLDLLVITHYAPAGRVFTDSVLAGSPLYQGLPVVQDGRVLVVEQGPQAQALATLGPLNVDVVLPLVREGAQILLDRRS